MIAKIIFLCYNYMLRSHSEQSEESRYIATRLFALLRATRDVSVSRSFPKQIGSARDRFFGGGARKVRTLANFVCREQ